MIKVLNLGALVLDPKLQSRTETNESTIEEYADAIKMGDEFPPLLVYFDGTHYWLVDGYHRYHAHKKVGKAGVACEVVNGTFTDAVLRATSVNTKHGMRRTYADKRKAVMTLLDDFEWRDWSNAEIARHCGVSPTFVANLRESGGPDEVKYKTATGKVMTKAKAPGKAKEPELKGPEITPPQQEQDDQNQEAIDMLLAENEELKARVAVVAMEGTPEEKQAATDLISELREELRITKIELNAVKQSRDQYQSENSQLKKQVLSMQRQLKKEQA